MKKIPIFLPDSLYQLAMREIKYLEWIRTGEIVSTKDLLPPCVTICIEEPSRIQTLEERLSREQEAFAIENRTREYRKRGMIWQLL